MAASVPVCRQNRRTDTAQRVGTALRRAIRGAADRYRENLARGKLAVPALLKCLCQIHWVSRPWLDDCVVVAAPASIYQPKPQMRARFQGKLVEDAVALRFHGKPAILQVGCIVSAVDTRGDIGHEAHVSSVEQRPVVPITRFPQGSVVRLRHDSRTS